MNRQQDASILDPAFIPFRFVFGHAQSRESTDKTASDSSSASPGKRTHNGSGRYEGPKARDRQGSNPGKPAKGAPKNHTAGGACGSAFRSLCILFVGEILGSDVLWE
jgi:hypothetical protein